MQRLRMLLQCWVVCLLLASAATSSEDSKSKLTPVASIGSCKTSGRLHDREGGILRGIDPTELLQLSWTIDYSGPTRGLKQLGYEIELTADETPLWTKRVVSERMRAAVPVALVSGKYYNWRVRATLNNGETTAWSSASTFETEPKEPFASLKWIGGGGQLRLKNAFVVRENIQKATLRISGLGAFYAYINGAIVGKNFMDPPQSVYSKTVYYSTFDVTDMLKRSVPNEIGVLLGNYKFGYTDLWCNQTLSGPKGCKTAILSLIVEGSDGVIIRINTSNPTQWQARQGPIQYDHLFHGETFDGRVGFDWEGQGNDWQTAVEVVPAATAPTGLQVLSSSGAPVAIGSLKQTISPPLRFIREYNAQSMQEVNASDVGRSFIIDFGQNLAGIVRMTLPPNHGIPGGTALRISHAEIIQGGKNGIEGMCKLCPSCNPCKSSPCDARGQGAVCNVYCNNPGVNGEVDSHPLRHEPCFPHQDYTPGFPAHAIGPHDTPYGFIGDFNNANQTNLYYCSGSIDGEVYTPFFSAAGFRFIQVSGFPSNVEPKASWFTSIKVNTDVRAMSNITFPNIAGTTHQTSDIINKIHQLTLESQTSNLFSIPTDCPQRERRGWMGDAQTTSQEALLNFDMYEFYIEFLDKMRDDQLRYNANHPTDKGALPDVVPYDGIGGEPGCPIWSVAYVVIARNLLKFYGVDALPTLKAHYEGLEDLMGWFLRHADPSDHLLKTKCYGDWMGYNPGSRNGGSSSLTPSDLVTAFHIVVAKQFMGEIAEAIGNSTGAEIWRKQAKQDTAAFHNLYYDPSAGGYAPCEENCYNTSKNGSQTSNALALYLNCMPDNITKARVVENLVSDIVNFGNRTTCGISGFAYLFDALGNNGKQDIAMRVLMNDAFPSVGWFGYQGMTTLCENLACTRHDNGGGSQNHIMFGGFDKFLVDSVGGISSSADDDIVFRPVMLEGKHGKMTKRVAGGVASLEWSRTTKNASFHMTVPVGSKGIFYPPIKVSNAAIRRLDESGTLVWQRNARDTHNFPEGVSLNKDGDDVIVRILSGTYHFSAVYYD